MDSKGQGKGASLIDWNDTKRDWETGIFLFTIKNGMRCKKPSRWHKMTSQAQTAKSDIPQQKNEEREKALLFKEILTEKEI